MPTKEHADVEAILIASLAALEAEAIKRPSSEQQFQRIEEKVSALLSEHRTRDRFVPETKTMIEAVDALRKALRKAREAHQEAQGEVRAIEDLINRGHLQQAVSKTNQVREKVLCFSDLNLDFIEEAKIKQQRRQTRLLLFGFIAAVIILIMATIIELLRRPAPITP